MTYGSLMRAFLLLLLAFVSPACASEYPAKVVGVSDGDTLTVLVAGNRQVKVRLHGIDAPETGQDFGSRAKQIASEMAFGKQVTVREVGRDRYGRTVAEVILPDERSLNREMVRSGMAWWFRRYAPADRELASLEAEARAAKRGLWAQAEAVPPWGWRNGRGIPVTAEVVGNRRSFVYHAPHCRGAAAMSEKNRVQFKTAAEAEAAGYRRAGDCQLETSEEALPRIQWNRVGYGIGIFPLVAVPSRRSQTLPSGAMGSELNHAYISLAPSDPLPSLRISE